MGCPDPCCGISLRKATGVVAIIDIIHSLLRIAIGAFLFMMVLKEEKLEKNSTNLPESNSNVDDTSTKATIILTRIAQTLLNFYQWHRPISTFFALRTTLIVICVSAAIELILAIILLLGTFRKNVCSCRAWLFIAVPVTVINVAMMIGEFASDMLTGISVTGLVISSAICIYSCWVVIAFIYELQIANLKLVRVQDSNYNSPTYNSNVDSTSDVPPSFKEPTVGFSKRPSQPLGDLPEN